MGSIPTALLVDVTRLMADMEDGRCLDEAARLRAALESGDELEVARLLRAYGYAHASVARRTTDGASADVEAAPIAIDDEQVIGLAVDVGVVESRVDDIERKVEQQAREVAHHHHMIRYMIDHPNAS